MEGVVCVGRGVVAQIRNVVVLNKMNNMLFSLNYKEDIECKIIKACRDNGMNMIRV